MLPEYRVHAIRLGKVDFDMGPSVPGREPNIQSIPVWAAVVEGNGSLILVDTGIKDAVRHSRLAPTTLDPEETLKGRMATLGWKLSDVDVVVNTHLHCDHAENNRDVPDARFFVSRTEWEYALAPDTAQAALYDFDWTGTELTFLNYTLIDVDHYDVLPGVRLIQTPGHTPGHQSVLVNTAEGVLCVVGDAAGSMENLTAPSPPGINSSSSEAIQSIHKIRRYCDRVFMSHDPNIDEFQEHDFPIVPPLSGWPDSTGH